MLPGVSVRHMATGFLRTFHCVETAVTEDPCLTLCELVVCSGDMFQEFKKGQGRGSLLVPQT